MKSKKISSIQTKQILTPRFAEVINESVNTTVDPTACVPLTRIRKISQSGVDRLKSIFTTTGFTSGSDLAIVMPLTGAHRHHLSSHFQSLGLSSDEVKEKIDSRTEWFGIVDGFHRYTAIMQLTRDEDEQVRKEWETFKWPVTMLKGGFQLLTLRQLARSQNEKHSDAFYVEPTFYDVLSGLREEYDRLQGEKSAKKITISEVAAAYDGASHAKESTLKQIAATAARLSHIVIDTIGKIMNEELVELAAVQLAQKDRPDYTIARETITCKIDCRVFRRFLNITSLKQSTIFMKGEGEDGEQVQVNTLYRLRGLCQEKQYRPVQHSAVTEQYKKASKALYEARKFEKFLESGVWPSDMEATHENLLRTTRLDGEVEDNIGNDNEILPFLRRLFFKLYPSSGPIKEAKYRAQFGVQANSSTENNIERGETSNIGNGLEIEAMNHEKRKESDDTTTPVATLEEANVPIVTGRKAVAHNSPMTESNFPRSFGTPDFCDLLESEPRSVCARMDTTGLSSPRQNSVLNKARNQTQTSERLDTGRHVDSTVMNCKFSDGPEDTSPYRLLQIMGIECHQMPWQEYDVRVRKSDDSQADMILTDPPYGLEPNASGAGQNYCDKLDDKEISSFCQFANRVLKPGGFVFIFSSVRYFQKWIYFLRETGFRAMSHVFSITKCPKRIQFHRLSSFPQNMTEYGIVARKGGSHPQQFEPDFSSPYHRISCPLPRRFASITNVPVTTNKLKYPGKKSIVRVEEKSTDLLVELLTTFCPDGGLVLDAYGGTLTTALACIETRRSCVSIEKDPECFRLAHERLRKKISTLKRPVDRVDDTECGVQTRKKQRIEEGKENTDTHHNLSRMDGANNTIEQGTILDSLRPDCDVQLLVDGECVGIAQLALPAPHEDYPVRRVLHNNSLEELSKNGQCLVVVWRVRIKPEMEGLQYSYEMPGVEDKPLTLADMQDSFYVWDANELQMMTS